MMLEKILRDKSISVYKCAKESNIPYTTLLEIVRGKTNIENCSAQTVYRLSQIVDMSMEELLEKCSVPDRVTFETFKSQVCHIVKNKGDIDFIIDTLNNDDVNKYWELKWYPEAFYTLAMLDYLSNENELPLADKYESIRACSLKEPLYPRDIILASKINNNSDLKETAVKEAIPEFMRFNIVERGVRDVF